MNRSKQKTMVFASLVFAAILFSALVVSDLCDAETGSVLTISSTPTDEQVTAISGGEYDEVVFSCEFTMDSLLSVPNGTKITAGFVSDDTKQGYIVLSIKNSDGSMGVLGSYETLLKAKNAFDIFRGSNNTKSISLILAEDSYTCGGSEHVPFVSSELDVQGNNSTLVQKIDVKGGECDFSIQDANFPSNVTMSFSDIKNLKVWGGRVSNTVLTVNITNCDSSTESDVRNNSFVMLRDGTYESSAKTVLNIEGCTIDGSKISDSAIHVTTAADVTITDCSFSNSNVPVNLNFKSTTYKSSVRISDCTFTDCGSSDTGTDLKSYSAPIRIVDSKDHDGTTSVTVVACSFDYSGGHSSVNGDILIGDGRTGKNSNSVDVSVYRTDAEVQIQKPGYYGGSYTVVQQEKCASHTSVGTGAMTIQGDDAPSTFVPTVTITVDNTIVMTIPENGTIYYTLDGSSPALDSSIYTGPIPVTGSWTVKALYISDNGFVSQISTSVTNYSPEHGADDDDDELPFIPGQNVPQTSSGSDDRTTLVAAAATIVVIMLAVVAIMATRNH